MRALAVHCERQPRHEMQAPGSIPPEERMPLIRGPGGSKSESLRCGAQRSAPGGDKRASPPTRPAACLVTLTKTLPVAVVRCGDLRTRQLLLERKDRCCRLANMRTAERAVTGLLKE